MKLSKDFHGLALPSGSGEEFLIIVTKDELELLHTGLQAFADTDIIKVIKELQRFRAEAMQMAEAMKKFTVADSS